jgi:hypothetical protein
MILVSIWFHELGMKFEAFKRSQGEVQQNVKPRSPWSTSDHVDMVGRSPYLVGPAGWLASQPNFAASQVKSSMGISLHMASRNNPRQRGQFASKTQLAGHMWQTAGPSAALPPTQLWLHDRPWDPINTPFKCLVNTHHTWVEYLLVKVPDL